jgi:hypothetical protein
VIDCDGCEWRRIQYIGYKDGLFRTRSLTQLKTISMLSGITPSRCRTIRNSIQPPRSQTTQDIAEESTNPLENAISRMRALRTRFHTPRTQETQATTEEPTTPTASTFSHLRALRNRFQPARTQPSATSTDTCRFFPGRTSSS